MKAYILGVVLLLVIAGCAKAPQAQPEPAPEPESNVSEELGQLDSEVQDVSVEGLDELDTALADLEELEY